MALSAWLRRIPVLNRLVPYEAAPPSRASDLSLRDRLGNPIPADDPRYSHVYSFAGLMNTASRSYSWRWDEAYKESHENALVMRRDCWLQGLLRERQLPTEQLKWHLKPEDETDDGQAEAAEHLTKCVRAIPHFNRYLRSLLEALWYGRSAAHQTWGWVEVGGVPAYTVVDHHHVNGDKLQFGWDGTPLLLVYSPAAAELEAKGAEIVRTDRNVALALTGPWRQQYAIHKADCIDADFFEVEMAGAIHGVGIRHWVYWNDWCKKEVQSWLLDFMERTGLGLTVYYYEEGNPQSLQRAQDAAREDGRNTVIVWPRSPQGKDTGSGVERIETSPEGSAVLMRVLEYFDAQQERFIVGQVTSGDPNNTRAMGGGDAAAVHANTKYRKTRDDAESLAETLTEELVGPLQRFNRPGVSAKLKFCFDIEDPNAADKLEAFAILYDRGVEFDEDEVRGLLGFSRPMPGGRVLKKPDPVLTAPEGKPAKTGPGDKPEMLERGSEDGRWITIGGSKGADGKRHGGSPVFVQNGRITKGHPSLTGKKIDALKEPAEHGSHRQQLRQSKEYGVATWAKKARSEGLEAEHLHQLAAEIKGHHDAFADERKQVLRGARRTSEKMGHGSLATLHARAAQGIDSDAVRGLDDVAQATAASFPHHFQGHELDLPGRMLDMLLEGDPAHMGEEDAYGQAFEQLMRHKPREGEVPF